MSKIKWRTISKEQELFYLIESIEQSNLKAQEYSKQQKSLDKNEPSHFLMWQTNGSLERKEHETGDFPALPTDEKAYFMTKGIKANFLNSQLEIFLAYDSFHLNFQQLIHLYFPEIKAYFTVKGVKTVGQKLVTEFPQIPFGIFCEEKRSDVRHNFGPIAPKQVELLFERNDRKYLKEMYDLSSLGFSFRADPAELQMIYEGDRIEMTKIGQYSVFNEGQGQWGQVRYIRSMHDYAFAQDYFRIGVVFENPMPKPKTKWTKSLELT
jgi:hypothetical protein